MDSIELNLKLIVSAHKVFAALPKDMEFPVQVIEAVRNLEKLPVHLDVLDDQAFALSRLIKETSIAGVVHRLKDGGVSPEIEALLQAPRTPPMPAAPFLRLRTR